MTCRLGGVGCTERTGGTLKARKALSREEKIIPSFRSRGTTRWPMPNGPVNGCLRKPSGNSPPAAGTPFKGSPIGGRRAGTRPNARERLGLVLPRRLASPLLPLRLALLFNPGGLQDLAH